MMNRRDFLRTTAAGLGTLAAGAGAWAQGSNADGRKPNIVFILSDDIGWGEIGCYGSDKVLTPTIDRIAREGVKFNSAYCGTSVCAPSRCALMTGLHMGHASVRANREIQPEGQMPMPADTVTVAHLLKRAGYKTACIGKWGLGKPDSVSTPDKMGFDHFFGYNCQRHAHGYYPNYLWRNGQHVELDGKTYSHDLMAAEALTWVRDNAASPFFLYLALTIPHARYEVPDLGPYADKDWPEVNKKMAAMITRMDRDIGRLLDLLAELKLADDTLVIFAGDNGAATSGKMLEFFNSNGPWRGIKRSMYEGGLRVPAVARWPGKIKPATTSDVPWAFWDFLPTAVEMAGAKLPDGMKIDGLSMVSTWCGGPPPKRDYLYWELYEGKFQQAIRLGDWKGVRTGPGKPLEVYDLKSDGEEAKNLAAEKPDVAAMLEAKMKEAHADDPNFPTTLGGGKGGVKKAKGPKAAAPAKKG